MKYLAAAIAVALLLAYFRSRRPVPATRWQESDEGVQPWDERTVTMASGGGAFVHPRLGVASLRESWDPKTWTN